VKFGRLQIKIVVTGAAGFIGSSLTKSLANRGHEVVAIDSFDSTLYSAEMKHDRAQTVMEELGLEVQNCDIASEALAEHLAGADVIVNEAAVPGLGPSWRFPDQYFHSNSAGVANILEKIRGTRVHLVQASTSSVYGIDASGDESTPCLPASPYGASKLAAEHLIRSHAREFDTKFTILRYYSVFGPKQRPDMAYAIFCAKMLAGEIIPINGDGQQRRNNTFVNDIVHATVLAAEAAPVNQTYNVCGDEETSVMQAVSVLADELQVKAKLEHRPRVSGDQARTKGVNSKIKQELGWSPNITLEEGLRLQARQAQKDFAVNA